MASVKQIINKAQGLPPLPGVVARVLQLTTNPDYSTQELVKTISLDPGITANVLRRCNSAFFGLRFKASSLPQAVTHLGSQNILEIALGAGVGPVLENGQPGYKLARGQLWRHSMATAIIAKRMASKCNLPDAPTLFTAALLHDVGKLVLSEYIAESLDQIEQLTVQEGWPLQMAEKKVLGVDHALLGAYIAKRWNLSDPIMETVAFHHRPSQAKRHRSMAGVVCLANYLAKRVGQGAGLGDETVPDLSPVLFDLNLYPQQLPELVEEMSQLMTQASGLLSLA